MQSKVTITDTVLCLRTQFVKFDNILTSYTRLYLSDLDQLGEGNYWYFTDVILIIAQELIIDAETGTVSSEYDFSYKLTQQS